MKKRTKNQKLIAFFLLVTFCIQTFFPATVLALTSGPSQPEAKSFKAAGVSDMVDLFTGNFSYNLPLLDVDGYPLNLNYQSGTNIDDEASWVGLGWNINVGAINRQIRGIPDDASGDEVETEHYTKPKITVGGRLTAKVEVKGKGTDKIKATGSFTLGVFSDNYTGIGAELGANAGISYSFAGSGLLTGGMGVGVMSSTASGVDVTPSLSLSYNAKLSESATVSPGLSASIGYNTRGGLKSLTLGSSFSVTGREVEKDGDQIKYGKSGSASYDVAGSVISYNTEAISPKIQVPYKSSYGSFSFDVGGLAWVVFGGGGGSGYRSIREVKSRFLKNPSYGFLYSERGKSKPDAMMDFIREKENIVIPEMPNLAIPVATPDLFSYTSQAGSGQFRLYRGGTGIFFDNKAVDDSETQTLGFDAGFGAYFHGGVSFYEQTVKNSTQRWSSDNQFAALGDFQDPSKSNPEAEHVFFRQVGEKTVEDPVLVQALKGLDPIAVDISGKTALNKLRISNTNSTTIASSISKQKKQEKRTVISYLTAAEAQNAALEKTIKSYPFITYDEALPFQPAACHQLTPNSPDIPRTGGTGNYRKAHHISEITVTDEKGKRNVYGLPVYNFKQEEYSFAIGAPGIGYTQSPEDQQNNLVNLGTSINHYKGIDHYFHKEKQAPYATNYLLTGILSPDYMDVTGNGITDDDLGTAMKFNYSKRDGLYKWRSPYTNKAIVNKGMLADPDDDKASFVYGEKELWYLHSIETKTKIAYFITDDREDGLGVIGWLGGVDGSQTQKVLREIRLYSKADLTKPIKVVKMDYGYDLCQNVPNFNSAVASMYPNKGKLTLKKVYFQYGNTDKGKEHPYLFTYNNQGSGDPFIYGSLLTDRWGSYKSRQSNSNSGVPLANDEYPYSTQNKSDADAWSGIWQLSKIELPTGGEINVTYESDDYAFVQNKRAAVMSKPQSLIDGNGNTTTNLRLARGIRITVPEQPGSGVSNMLSWFRQNYLSGSNYLYTKFFVNLGGIDSRSQPLNQSYYDFVPCHAKVSSVTHLGGGQLNVFFETLTDGGVTSNPIIHAAWQRLRSEYPRYAYPGYKNRIQDNNFSQALKAAISAIFNAAKNLDELRRNFNERARDADFAINTNLDKSFVRLTKADGKKLGGGSRVRKISISDKWAMMSGNTNTSTATYGQSYDYTTIIDGKIMSSGVASYEPNVGADENPLRQPVPYIQRIKGALNNLFSLEEPFGESYFPGASIGYSKVTVRDLDENGNPDPEQKTGYVVNDFYTSREFPVQLRSLTIKPQQSGPRGWYSLFGSYSLHELTFSQGYSIELNDMHGKPKAIRVYNQSGSEISSTVYEYNTESLNAGELRLKNVVKVVNEKGEIENDKIIGREIEVFTDMREQDSRSIGQTIMIGGDVFPLPFFGVPGGLPHWPKKQNDEIKLFRSASTMKVIQYYGILDRVLKTENGSTVVTDNIAYDGLTGEVVVSSIQNEFDKPVYSVNIPAYWVYKGMGGAYRNTGTVISFFQTNSIGELINNSVINAFMQPGDEVINILNGNRYWIIETSPYGSAGSAKTKKLIDRNGIAVPWFSSPIKIVRSGYRNQLNPATSGFTCLANPISAANKLEFASNADLTALKVISATTTLFDENWGIKPECSTCPVGYKLSADGQYCDLIPIENTNYCFTYCRGGIDADGNYGLYGAQIQETTSSTPVSRLSHFWGGNCGSCTRTAGITAPAPKLDSSITKDGIQIAGTERMMIPTGSCTRSDYGENFPCGTGLCGRLATAGIWLCMGTNNNSGLPANEWIGFETCLNVTSSKNYYIGYAVDNHIRIYIDNVLWKSLTTTTQNTFRYWYVSPAYLSAGNHTLRVEFNNSGGAASAAVEVYDNTFSQLTAPNFDQSTANIIFSTARDITGKPVQAYRDITGTGRIARYTCSNGSLPDVCTNVGCSRIPVNRNINPYVKGYMGNWRESGAKAYQTNRKYDNIFDGNKKGIDVKNAGYLDIFKPYWYYATGDQKWKEAELLSKEWVTGTEITLYDKYGQELENRNAIGKYEAASYMFRGDRTSAVAQNTRNREIYYDGFEDYRFRFGCTASDTGCFTPVFSAAPPVTPTAMNNYIATSQIHTGNYSVILPGSGINLTTNVHTKEHKQEPYLDIGSNGLYTTRQVTGLYPVGFEPLPNGKYVVSAWVKDDQPSTLTAPVTLTVNGVSFTVTRKATVEKWKQVEGIIDLSLVPLTNNKITIQIRPVAGGSVFLDDVRIQPFEANMKTFVYDDKTLRLMAELDENNFATLYEYDDEGNLIRLKKETDRGIITIKEMRHSYKKRQ
ncbi:MAG TPA: hypothetical protein VGD17_16485 [Chitinophagaceae bacterium]